MQERHFSFHIAQTDPIIIRYVFVLQKNNGLLDWQEEKLENSYIIAFPAKIIPGNAMAGKHDRTLLSFKTADLNKG